MSFGDPQLESRVSRLLDEAGVPNFIWAEPALGIYGVGTAVFFNAWVVPDEFIDKATQALDEAQLPPCTQGRDRCSVFWERRTHPYPDRHWHTDLFYPPRKIPPEGGPMTCGVFLYCKSRLFWTFPEPPVGRPAPDDPYYMLTSDPRIVKTDPMARGRQSDSLYPVKIPVPGRYMEAMFLLTLRHLEGTMVLMHYEIELRYLASWVLEPGINLTLEDIAEPFREWARLMADEGYARRQGDAMAQRYPLQLYAEMKRNNSLPPPDEMRMEAYVPLDQRLRKYNIPSNPEWFIPAAKKVIWRWPHEYL